MDGSPFPSTNPSCFLVQTSRNSSSGFRLGQPSPEARHHPVRLAVHVDINNVPIGSLDHFISGHAVQTASTNDGRPDQTPQPFGWERLVLTILAFTQGTETLHCMALVTGSGLRQCSQKMSSPPGFRSLCICWTSSSSLGSEHCDPTSAQTPRHPTKTITPLQYWKQKVLRRKDEEETKKKKHSP